MGACIEHARVRNSPQTCGYDTAQPNCHTRMHNNPKTWEHDMAQPVILACLQYSLGDFNHNKTTALDRKEILVLHPAKQVISL